MSEIKESERSDESTYDLDAIPGMPDEDRDEELEQPVKSNPALGQPLPRLWKGEPDPAEKAEETAPGRPLKKTAKGGDEDKPGPKKASTPKVKATAPKPKPKPADDGDETDKKVLIEDTPKFDTIEARQRARLIVGGLGVFCVMLACYIGYRVLFGGGGTIEADLSGEEPPMVAQASPAARPSLENEARYMLNRARDLAKAGRTDQAVGMLTRIVASYKGTESAAEARAAMARPSQNLPLFPDGPALLAERKPVAPPPAKATTPGKPSGPPPTATAPIATGPPPVVMSPQPQPAQPQTTPTPPARAQLAPPPNVLAQMTPPPTAQPQTTPPPRAQPQTTPPSRAQVQLAPSPAVQAQTIPPPAARPQTTPSQPVAQAQPTQPAPPPGPGQVAMIVPADPPARAEAPTTVERPADGGAGVAPRTPTRRELPPGFKARAEAGYHESGWPRIIVGDRDGGPMVLVPGGTFTMGSDKGEPVEAPAHIVRLSTFYIDQYEVTNKQFRTFLDDSRRNLPPGKWPKDEKPRDASPAAPAVYVNWRDAEAFAIWAGKRLPTEAQWEMAAQSTDGRRYPWGDQPIKSSRPREFGRVDPVGSFAEDSSVYGAFDMAGNVMEWTRDWYEPNYFRKVGDKIPENPTGPSSKRQNSIQRVVKGGSKTWTVSFRQGVDLDKRAPNLGFRCALAVEGPEASAVISPHPVKPAAQPGIPPPGAGPPVGDVPF